MPTAPTYPGVYVEEVPSSVRPIVGVPTSVTAFIGRTSRGPADEPVVINTWGDYERIFGGLWQHSTMSYSVSDYFANGGAQALVVRLFRPLFDTEQDRTDAAAAAADTAAAAATEAADPSATAQSVADAAQAVADDPANANEPRKSAADAVASAAQTAAAEAGADPQSVADAAQVAADDAAPRAFATASHDSLTVTAAYPGAWGNRIRLRVDHDVLGPDAANLFNLTVLDGSTGNIESFRNVSHLAGHERQVDAVLESRSRLVRCDLPATRPVKHDDVGVGDDPFDPANSTSTGVDANGEASDGNELDSTKILGSEADKRGMFALEGADIFNLLVIPPYAEDKDIEDAVWEAAASYCRKRRAFLIIDPPSGWLSKDHAKAGISVSDAAYAALYFPRIRRPDPKRDGRLTTYAPGGAVAGVYARTDGERGVWKAPAGLDARLANAPDLTVPLTDAENGELNPLGVNCLRSRPPAGRVIWGARTRDGDDRLASQWKYVPIRRLALFIEESLYRGTQWVVFEPNDEPLWADIRLNVGAFMHRLFRQGAFQGSSPADAYFVKVDSETTTQADIDLGIVNIDVGFAPLKPAEFVIIRIQQMAGQIAT